MQTSPAAFSAADGEISPDHVYFTGENCTRKYLGFWTIFILQIVVFITFGQPFLKKKLKQGKEL